MLTKTLDQLRLKLLLSYRTRLESQLSRAVAYKEGNPSVIRKKLRVVSQKIRRYDPHDFQKLQANAIRASNAAAEKH